MLTVGSLFSGIGGLDLGLERAGMTVRWQVEIDDYCRRVLAKHWPDVKRYEDVRDVGSELERVDVVAGGFPCQPVSHAGKQKGDADERWLWDEFARVVREVRPRWVLAENVPGLLSTHAGRLFGTVLRDLAACGYDAEWDCIPAAAVGAHFVGDRVFVVAHRAPSDCVRWEGQRPNPMGAGPWRQHELERLVQLAVSTGIPAGRSGRISDGVPKRVDRLRGLGNAVVPQVAEYIGRMIVEAENQCPSN